MRILITGGAGFIATNLAGYLLERYPDYKVFSLATVGSDAARRNITQFLPHPNYTHLEARIEDLPRLGGVLGSGLDVVVNLAAQSHVNAGLSQPSAVVHDNVLNTQTLLEWARDRGVRRFVQVSSSEVYGPIGRGCAVSESARLEPVSTYGASKAGADLLALAFHRSTGMDVIVTRCTNNYGPFQRPDKLIPMIITRALLGQPVPMYGDGNQVRDWLHVSDHCAALDVIMHNGTPGLIYNISSHHVATTRQIITSILRMLQRPWSLVQTVPARPGDADRYSPNCDRLRTELGWRPRVRLEDGLCTTLAWYVQHRDWWEGAAATVTIR